MHDRQPLNYKKYTLVLLLITVGALIVCAAAFSLKQAAAAAGPAPEAMVTEHYTPKQAASQETVESYVVTVRDGRIAVFRSGIEAPVLESEVQVYLLPQGDQDLLKKGIHASSLSEARAILEDYE